MPPYLGESQESVINFLSKIDLSKFESPFNTEEILRYIDQLENGNNAAKASIDIALHDLQGKLLNKRTIDILNIKEKPALSSFTIGIDTIEKMLEKVDEAEKYDFKILKNFQDLIFISLEFDKIINLDVLNTKEIYNIHFSALPKYRGVYTSSLPILNQEKYSGVTLHKIDEGIDTGPIISQKIFQIPQHYTAIELYNRYCDEAIELFKMNFMDLVQKRSVQLYPQDHNDSTYFSKSSINFSKTEIEFAFTTAEVVAKINSLIFPEYQLPTFKGREIIGVQPGVNKIFGPCGLTVKLDNKTDQVFTLDSYVILLYQDN
jgi:methionyl-tRNA formyltransferase